jgi:hypothetical protein
MKTGPNRYEFTRRANKKINYPFQMNIRKRHAGPQRSESPNIPPVGTFGLAGSFSPSQKSFNILVSLFFIPTKKNVIHLRRRK